MKMIDIAEKDKTWRVAIARAELRCSRETLKLLNEGRLEKGDALAAARLAGIMAAKRTPGILPLCHPLVLAGPAGDGAPDPRPGGGRAGAPGAAPAAAGGGGGAAPRRPAPRPPHHPV